MSSTQQVLDVLQGWDVGTAKLALQLQLEDIGFVKDGEKGKGKVGELTDLDVSLQLLTSDLKHVDHILEDRALAQSIANAVETDGEILCQITQQEAQACSDRAIARRLSGTPATSGVANSQSPPEELSDFVLARFAGLYNSEDLGDVLHNRTMPQKRGGAADAAPTAEGSNKRRRAQIGDPEDDSPNMIECTTCGEGKRQFEVITVPCGHDYCIDCIRGLFAQSTTDESLFPPRCCRLPIDFSQVSMFFSKTLRDEFSMKQIEFSTTRRTYCAQKACSAFILPENIAADTGTCSMCTHQTCVICKGEAHSGDCPQDPALQQTLALAAEQGWQRCRNCQSMVELDVGCNHIRCRCGAEFCYLCGQRWKTCRCAQWNEDRLYARANIIAQRDVRAGGNGVDLGNVERAAQMLRDRHNCDHQDWTYIRGEHQCEECHDRLPAFIFRCSRCEIQMCRRCKQNRL